MLPKIHVAPGTLLASIWFSAIILPIKIIKIVKIGGIFFNFLLFVLFFFTIHRFCQFSFKACIFQHVTRVSPKWTFLAFYLKTLFLPCNHFWFFLHRAAFIWRNWPPLRRETLHIPFCVWMCFVRHGEYVNCSIADLSWTLFLLICFFFFLLPLFLQLVICTVNFIAARKRMSGRNSSGEKDKDARYLINSAFARMSFIIGGRAVDVNFNQQLLFSNYVSYLRDDWL